MLFYLSYLPSLLFFYMVNLKMSIEESLRIYPSFS
jgi:hypothetical protein